MWFYVNVNQNATETTLYSLSRSQYETTGLHKDFKMDGFPLLVSSSRVPQHKNKYLFCIIVIFLLSMFFGIITSVF